MDNDLHGGHSAYGRAQDRWTANAALNGKDCRVSAWQTI